MISIAVGRLILHTSLDDPLYVSPCDIVGISKGKTNPKFSHLIIRHFGVLEVQETVEDILDAISEFRENKRIVRIKEKANDLKRTLDAYMKMFQHVMSEFDEKRSSRDRDDAGKVVKDLMKNLLANAGPLSLQSFGGIPEPPGPGGKDVINDKGENLVKEDDNIDCHFDD